MSNVVYNAGIARLVNTGWANVRSLLVGQSGGYVPNKDEANLLVIATAEIATTNYSRIVVTSNATTIDNVSDKVSLSAASVVFPALGPAIGGPVVAGIVLYFYVNGTNVNDVPFAYLDGGDFPVAVDGQDFSVFWNISGLAQLYQI